MPQGQTDQELGGNWTNTLATEIEDMLGEIVDELVDAYFVDEVPPLTEKLTIEDLLAMDDKEAITELQIMLMDPFEQAEGAQMMGDWLEARFGLGASAAAMGG